MRWDDIFVYPGIAMNVTIERIVGSLYAVYSYLRRKMLVDFLCEFIWIVPNHHFQGY